MARKAAGGALEALNRHLVLRWRGGALRAELALGWARAGRAPWAVIVVRDLLHFAVPCIELASRHAPLLIVLNGTRDWEGALLRRRFPALPVVDLRPAPGSALPHGLALDLLLAQAPDRLGLLDPDLYVFDPGLLARLAPAPGELAAGAFGVLNRRTGLRFPTTHLLALDVPALRGQMRRHGIGATIRRRTPRQLVGPLAALGLGDHNYPKDYLSCYDPLNLLMAAALCDGLRLRVLDAGEEQAAHFGGVTYGDRTAHADYLEARMVALPGNGAFAGRLAARGIGSRPPGPARARMVAAGQGSVADWIDRALARIEAELAGRPGSAR